MTDKSRILNSRYCTSETKNNNNESKDIVRYPVHQIVSDIGKCLVLEKTGKSNGVDARANRIITVTGEYGDIPLSLRNRSRFVKKVKTAPMARAHR
jgi:hypothetical protein